MYRFCVILFLVIICFSCRPSSDDESTPPDYALNEEQFIKVLTDCYLGEGATGINVKNLNGDKFDSAYLFNPFKDNGITKAQLDTTIAYYSKHPKKLKLIYNKILDNLSQILALGTVGKLRVITISEKYIGVGPVMYLQLSKMDSVNLSKKKAGYEPGMPVLYKIR